jgi:DNA primase
MPQVLETIGFTPTRWTGDQWYGPCPLHAARHQRELTFSVNVATGRYYCHRCHSHGNQLELWAAFTGQTLHPAVIQLCHALGRDVPWISPF